MNKPRTQPNRNKKWTCRNAQLAIFEILDKAGFTASNYVKRRISNIIYRTAEYHVFEGHNISKATDPAEQREYTKTYYIDGEKYEKKYTIRIEKPS